MLRSPKARLAAAAALFALWIGYLGFLAATTARPVVLSRPQFLVSGLYVVATLEGKEQPGEMVTVVRAGGPGRGQVKKDDRLRVVNLPKVGQPPGWDQTREYILPLSRRADDAYEITPLPRTPGYPADLTPAADRLRIYPVTPNTLRQLEEIEQGR